MWAAVNSTAARPSAAPKGKVEKRHYNEEKAIYSDVSISKEVELLLSLVGREKRCNNWLLVVAELHFPVWLQVRKGSQYEQ